jgi:hypothetical protein
LQGRVAPLVEAGVACCWGAWRGGDGCSWHRIGCCHGGLEGEGGSAGGLSGGGDAEGQLGLD